MGVKAKVPEWRRRFDEAYALRPGQVLKRVGPPYPAERADFAFYTVAGTRDDPHYSYVLRWDGRPRMWGSKRGDLLRDNVLVFVLGFGKAEIVGPRELVEMHVPGDWVIRPGASKADLLKGLETILRDELKQPVTFTEREVERDVLVAKGRYQFHPLGDLPGETAVHLGTAALPSSEGGGGSGTLRQMLDWLGDRTNVMVVDEAEGFPAVSRIVWRDHLAEHAADIGANTEAGRSTLDRVLANLTKQTELTFHRERRRAKVWVVSRRSGHCATEDRAARRTQDPQEVTTVVRPWFGRGVPSNLARQCDPHARERTIGGTMRYLCMISAIPTHASAIPFATQIGLTPEVGGPASRLNHALTCVVA